MLGDGLVAEEVLTVQAAAQLLQKTQDVVYAVHHRKAEEVLLPIEGRWRRESEHLNPQMKRDALLAWSLVKR